MEDDLYTDSVVYSSRLTAVHWAKVSQSENPELICPTNRLYPGRLAFKRGRGQGYGGREEGSNFGRTQLNFGRTQEARGLLNEIMRTTFRLEVKGRRRYSVTGDPKSIPTQSVPETIWAAAQ